MTLAEYLSWKQLKDGPFAALLGVDRSAVARWRTGARVPSKDHMRRIREITGGAVTADDFFELSTTSTRRAG
jgi:DNA-binding transcriptional regulator YdaS (Cro superfamily)